jgi:hypothetical protein
MHFLIKPICARLRMSPALIVSLWELKQSCLSFPSRMIFQNNFSKTVQAKLNKKISKSKSINKVNQTLFI